MKIKTTHAIALEAADTSSLHSAALTLETILDKMRVKDISSFYTAIRNCTKTDIEDAIEILKALAFEQLLIFEEEEG